jgi:uncharacterized protein
LLNPDPRAKITLEARISPSEDPVKVSKALGKVAGSEPQDVLAGPSSASVTTDDLRALTRIRDQLRDRHIRSAARKQMLLNKQGRLTTLMLNRQAATVGVLALCGSPDESPLGPIYMSIESDALESVIDWLTAYPG